LRYTGDEVGHSRREAEAPGLGVPKEDNLTKDKPSVVYCVSGAVLTIVGVVGVVGVVAVLQECGIIRQLIWYYD